MPSFTSFNVFGTEIDSGEIGANQVTFDKLGTDLDKWELLETLDYTNNSSKTTGTLKVCNEYMIRTRLKTTTSALNTAGIRINGVTSSIYLQQTRQANTLATTTSTSILIACGYDQNTLLSNCVLNGKSSAQADGMILFLNNGCFSQYGAISRDGYLPLGNEQQVSTITVFSTSSVAMNGTVEIYGR